MLNINFLNDSQKHWSWDYCFFKKVIVIIVCAPEVGVCVWTTACR